MRLVHAAQHLVSKVIDSLSCPRCGRLTFQMDGLLCLACLMDEQNRFTRVMTAHEGTRVVLCEDFPEHDLYAGDPGTVHFCGEGKAVVFDHAPDVAYEYLRGRHVFNFCDTLIMKRECPG